jgi:hypothetical protein
MKLPKFLTFVVMTTMVSLLYVYQQTEIFRMAYVGQKKMSCFQDLLDKNSALRYNIEESTSLVRIGNKLSDGKDYEMPETYRLVKLTKPLDNLELSQRAYNKKENSFAQLFTIKRQAEASAINP